MTTEHTATLEMVEAGVMVGDTLEVGVWTGEVDCLMMTGKEMNMGDITIWTNPTHTVTNEITTSIYWMVSLPNTF